MIASAAPVAAPPTLLALLLPFPAAVAVFAVVALAAVAGLVVEEMRVEDAGPRRVRRRVHQPPR